MKTFGSILDANKGHGPGFDFMRLALSISIVLFHTDVVCFGSAREINLWNGPLGGLCAALLPVFFALSGFLVMGSALRAKSLRAFMTLRALRIAPALLTEITLSALILGAVFTQLPLARYFTNKVFVAYFGSLFGRVRVRLPEVFSLHPLPDVVNTSLATIRPELGCYVFMAILICIGVARQRRLLSIACGIVLGVNLALDIVAWRHHELRTLAPPRLLLLSFAMGNLAYDWRNRIPYRPILFIAALGLGVGLVKQPAFASLGVIALTYCIAYAGLTVLPKIPLLSRGDYSYGIYLYGFPIQQTMWHLFAAARAPFGNFVLSLPIVIALAMASWHLIEQPTLSLRKRVTNQGAIVHRDPVVLAGLVATLALYGLYLSGVLERSQEGFDRREALIIALIALSAAITFLLSRIRGFTQRAAQPVPSR